MDDSLLKKWALMAEILGGVAVVFSLVFVGLQIRQSSEQTEQNTIALEVNAYQNLVTYMNDMYMEMFTNPDLAAMNFRLGRNEISRDDPEWERLTFYFGYAVRLSDMAYLQFERGLISEEQLISTFGPLEQIVNTDIGLRYWNFQIETRRIGSNFSNFVDEHLLVE